jgi:hypothetical protein
MSPSTFRTRRETTTTTHKTATITQSTNSTATAAHCVPSERREDAIKTDVKERREVRNSEAFFSHVSTQKEEKEEDVETTRRARETVSSLSLYSLSLSHVVYRVCVLWKWCCFSSSYEEYSIALLFIKIKRSRSTSLVRFDPVLVPRSLLVSLMSRRHQKASSFLLLLIVLLVLLFITYIISRCSGNTSRCIRARVYSRSNLVA